MLNSGICGCGISGIGMAGSEATAGPVPQRFEPGPTGSVVIILSAMASDSRFRKVPVAFLSVFSARPAANAPATPYCWP